MSKPDAIAQLTELFRNPGAPDAAAVAEKSESLVIVDPRRVIA